MQNPTQITARRLISPVIEHMPQTVAVLKALFKFLISNDIIKSGFFSGTKDDTIKAVDGVIDTFVPMATTHFRTSESDATKLLLMIKEFGKTDLFKTLMSYQEDVLPQDLAFLTIDYIIKELRDFATALEQIDEEDEAVMDFASHLQTQLKNVDSITKVYGFMEKAHGIKNTNQ